MNEDLNVNKDIAETIDRVDAMTEESADAATAGNSKIMDAVENKESMEMNDIVETDDIVEETEKKPVPWYRNTRLMLLIVVVGIALYYIGTGLWGLFFG